MSSPIIGLSGRPADEEPKIVDPMGQEVPTTAEEEMPEPPELSEVDKVRVRFQAAMGQLIRSIGDKKVMSRGDLAESTKMLAQASHLLYQLIGMASSDVMALIDHFEQLKFNSFFMGNQIAALLELLLDKEVFTKDEMNAKWQEVAEKAKEEMLRARAEAEAGCEGCCAEDCEGCAGSCGLTEDDETEDDEAEDNEEEE